jgi:hypothetical protein
LTSAGGVFALPFSTFQRNIFFLEFSDEAHTQPDGLRLQGPACLAPSARPAKGAWHNSSPAIERLLISPRWTSQGLLVTTSPPHRTLKWQRRLDLIELLDLAAVIGFDPHTLFGELARLPKD